MSAMWGMRRAMRSKSSRDSSRPASWAMAGRWRAALVEPPMATTTAMAFSKARRGGVARAGGSAGAGQGVGGFTPAAGALAGAGPALQLVQLLLRHAAGLDGA